MLSQVSPATLWLPTQCLALDCVPGDTGQRRLAATDHIVVHCWRLHVCTFMQQKLSSAVALRRRFVTSTACARAGQSNGHTPQPSGVLGTTPAPTFSTAHSDGNPGGAGGPDVTGLSSYEPIWAAGPQQPGPSASNGFPPGLRPGQPASWNCCPGLLRTGRHGWSPLLHMPSGPAPAM